jgi:hypothetical protein
VVVAAARATPTTGAVAMPAPKMRLRVTSIAVNVAPARPPPPSPHWAANAKPARPTVARPTPLSRTARGPNRSRARPQIGLMTVRAAAETVITRPSWNSDSLSSRDNGARTGVRSCWAENVARTVASTMPMPPRPFVAVTCRPMRTP